MEQQNAAGAPATRPTFLTVLCILSFISAGISIVVIILALLAAMALQAMVSTTTEAVDAMAEGMSVEGVDVATTAADAASTGMGLLWAYVVVGILSTIVGLIGVIKMWKLQKMGFYLYTAASIVGVIMGAIYELSVASIVISLAFIVMYGLNLKHMK